MGRDVTLHMLPVGWIAFAITLADDLSRLTGQFHSSVFV